MATVIVQITGDTSSLTCKATNLTGADELVVLSGSFRGTSDDRRVCSLFLDTAGKTLEIRLEFIDQTLVETTFFGKPIYEGYRL